MSFPYAEVAGAVAAVGSGVAQGVSTGKLNRRNREWQEKMWAQTNEYNHPMNQMQRLREAGLNPHLIYGGGPGNTTTMAAAPVQHEQDFSGFANAAQNYVANRVQQTQVDNMKKAIEVQEADIILKRAQTQNTLSASAKTDQEKEQAAQLFQLSYDQAYANVQNTRTQGLKMNAEIDNIIADTAGKNKGIQLSDAQISSIQQGMKESQERIRNMVVDRNLKGLEAQLKRMEIEYRKTGGNWSDPGWMKLLMSTGKNSGLFDLFDSGVKIPKSGSELGKKILEAWQKAKELGVKLWQHQPEIGR